MKKLQRKKPERSETGKRLIFSNSREQLSKDFNHRCGYCDDSSEYACCSYHIDHFAPSKKFEHLQNDYNNFVYSCPYCNISKSDKWIGNSAEQSIVDGIGFVDPCDLKYNAIFERLDNGKIKPLNDLAEYIYYELKLYLKRHEILYLIEEINEKGLKLKQKIADFKSLGKNTEKLEKIDYELLKYFRDYYNVYRKVWNRKSK